MRQFGGWKALRSRPAVIGPASVLMVAGAMLATTLVARVPVAFAEDAAEEAEDLGPVDSAEARAILKNMGDFLAAQKKFRVEILAAHDTVQPSGQKIEFIDRRTVIVERPRNLFVEVEDDDGLASRVTINSSMITAQLFDQGVYAQIDAKPTLDESVRYFVDDLRMRLPLAMLLVSNLSDELGRRVVQADIVGKTSVLGQPAHQIAGSTDTVDFQIWVAAGSKPLPLRVVLTYREAEGQPQFRANFSNWDLSPWTRASTFEPKISKEERRIAFLPQVKLAAKPAEGAAR